MPVQFFAEVQPLAVLPAVMDDALAVCRLAVTAEDESTLRESFFCVEHAVTRTPAAVAHDTAPVFLWRRLARGEALWRAEAASNSFLRATPAQRGRPSRPRPLPGVVTMTL